MAKRKKERGDPVTPVRLLLDTCVWLDLAGSDANEPLLGALETLCRQHVIDIIVPQIVRDEFASNKDRVIRESGRSLAGVLRRARVAVWTHGDKRKRRNAAAVLDDIEHKLNNSPDNTAQAIARIEKIFVDSIWCGTNDEATLLASNRALQKKAPFHNGRNNFADALILELYGQMVENGKGRCVFRRVQSQTVCRMFRAPGRLLRLDNDGHDAESAKPHYVKSRGPILRLQQSRPMSPEVVLQFVRDNSV
jgi:hypothetical protein